MSLYIDVKYVIRGEHARRLYDMIRRYMADGRYAYRTKYKGNLSKPQWYLGDIFSEEIGLGYSTYESVTDDEDSIRLNEKGELELHFGLKNIPPSMDGYLLRYFPDMEIYMLYSDDNYGDGTVIATNDRDGSVFGVQPATKEELEDYEPEYSFSYTTLKPDEGEPGPWEYISRPEGYVYDLDEAIALQRQQADAQSSSATELINKEDLPF